MKNITLIALLQKAGQNSLSAPRSAIYSHKNKRKAAGDKLIDRPAHRTVAQWNIQIIFQHGVNGEPAAG